MRASNPWVQFRKIWTAHGGGVPFHPAPRTGLKRKMPQEQKFRNSCGVGEISTGGCPLLAAPEEMGKVRLANPWNLKGRRREGPVRLVGNKTGAISVIAAVEDSFGADVERPAAGEGLVDFEVVALEGMQPFMVFSERRWTNPLFPMQTRRKRRGRRSAT
jgi:hypothetical protein